LSRLLECGDLARLWPLIQRDRYQSGAMLFATQVTIMLQQNGDNISF